MPSGKVLNCFPLSISSAHLLCSFYCSVSITKLPLLRSTLSSHIGGLLARKVIAKYALIIFRHRAHRRTKHKCPCLGNIYILFSYCFYYYIFSQTTLSFTINYNSATGDIRFRLHVERMECLHLHDSESISLSCPTQLFSERRNRLLPSLLHSGTALLDWLEKHLFLCTR